MPRDLIPSGEHKTISHEIEPHNRPFDAQKLERKGNVQPTRSRAEARAKMLRDAQDRLEKLHPAQARDLIQGMPIALYECYFLAEEVGLNRDAVLRGLPKPGPRARARYIGEPTESPAAVVGIGASGEVPQHEHQA